MNKAYALKLCQYTLVLTGESEQRKDCESNIKHNEIKILIAIKEITHNYQDSKYPIASIFKSMKIFVHIKQEEKESLAYFNDLISPCRLLICFLSNVSPVMDNCVCKLLTSFFKASTSSKVF